MKDSFTITHLDRVHEEHNRLKETLCHISKKEMPNPEKIFDALNRLAELDQLLYEIRTALAT